MEVEEDLRETMLEVLKKNYFGAFFFSHSTLSSNSCRWVGSSGKVVFRSQVPTYGPKYISSVHGPKYRRMVLSTDASPYVVQVPMHGSNGIPTHSCSKGRWCKAAFPYTVPALSDRRPLHGPKYRRMVLSTDASPYMVH
jgi:hypothetical protein